MEKSGKNARIAKLPLRFLGMVGFLGAGLIYSPSAGHDIPSAPVGRIQLDENWQMKSSVLVADGGQQVSMPDYQANEWYPTRLPATALSTLIRNGVYPDIRIGLNSFRIPDASDEFNKQHDLAKYSYLPDGRNPWRDPYWFRTVFQLPKSVQGRRIWLVLKGINYRADVWVNGRQIADARQVVGAFSRYRLDITEAARPGQNGLALSIHTVDHPGEPDLQLEPLGPCRSYQKEIMRDVTLVMSIGYDCMPTVPDRHLGLWQGVAVEWTGPVDIRHPFVRTELPLPSTSPAKLTVSAELANCSHTAIEGVLCGRLEQTGGEFSARVVLPPGQTQEVVFKPEEHPALIVENPRLWWPNGYGNQPLYDLRLQFYLTKPVQKQAERAEQRKASAPCVTSPSAQPVSPADGRSELAPSADMLSSLVFSAEAGGQLAQTTQTIYSEKILSEKRASGLNASANLGQLSDQEHVRFGIRQVKRELYRRGHAHGLRVYVNGQRIFCRGGYLQPEILFDWDARRMETEVRYLAEARMNLVYFEDIPVPPEEFLDACDRYGLMFGNCFYGCYWMQPGTNHPEDLELLARSTVDIIKRIRNHPSLVLYMAMNEGETRREVYTMWREAIQQHDGTRLWIPSGSFPDYRKDVPEWIRQDLPAGINDYPPNSYGWVPPEQFFRWVREKDNWMFMLETGAPSVPPIESLRRFLPDLDKADPASPVYPLTDAWAHHDACSYFKPFDEALRRIFGQPKSVAEYCRWANLLSYDQHRAMFEAAQHRMWDITSGFSQWKLNACWPSVEWQLYDWYLRPMVSFFAVRKACEPVHVQMEPVDRMVQVVNNRFTPMEGLRVQARLLDFESRLRWQRQANLDIPANCFRDVFAIEVPEDISPVYFVRLDLADRNGRPMSQNFYWLAQKDLKELAHLEKLPPATVVAQMTLHPQTIETVAELTVQNPSDRIAFMVQLSICRPSDGAEILPVWWEDNYLSILPGETRQIRARFPTAQADGQEPVLKLTGWNLPQTKN
ncbi:MAG: beta galactosidase jelly roll domain-containing protein [Thermoguttaceae bacterium]|nr:beta galactosidase jelly roll domain-containing protein [Thermoguttaceae bacterium]MDW8039084.1 beta galactosidase jelly roll domain-containing protein [Thermoguttaceae bacterium]